MKKIISALLALVMLCGFAALAEGGETVTAHDYLGEWVDRDGTTNIDIVARDEGDGYIVNVQTNHAGDGVISYTVYAYACVYDEESRELKSFSRVTGEGDYEPDTEENITDIDFEYADAGFRFDDAHYLIWDDKGLEIDDGMAFDHTIGWIDPDYVGPGHHFVGEWNDGRVSVEIRERMDGYDVSVLASGSAFDGAFWVYSCVYDEETDSLITDGELAEKHEYTYSEDGEDYSEKLVYDDCEAMFRLNEDGKLLWYEKKEDAGAGLAFELVPEEAAGKVIAPLDPGYDLTALGDGEYPVAFAPDALADGTLTLTVYSEDVYDIVDIDTMEAGDTFIFSGLDFPVESVERNDDLLVNGGWNNGGWTLRSYEEDNCWKVVVENDENTYTNYGKTTLPLAEDATFTDGWDIEKEPVTVNGAAAVAEAIAGSEMDYFSPFNTTVRVEDGRIVEIIREYMP